MKGLFLQVKTITFWQFHEFSLTIHNWPTDEFSFLYLEHANGQIRIKLWIAVKFWKHRCPLRVALEPWDQAPLYKFYRKGSLQGKQGYQVDLRSLWATCRQRKYSPFGEGMGPVCDGMLRVFSVSPLHIANPCVIYSIKCCFWISLVFIIL